MSETISNNIDPRLKLMSHSSDLTLHACPRLWELYRLNVTNEDAEEDSDSSMNFAFGHAVGEGIASVLQGKSFNETIFEMFLHWPLELDSENTYTKKGFYYAVSAIQKFEAMYTANILLKDYELVWIKRKLPDGSNQWEEVPAVEVGFKIIFPGGFIYRGHIDAVLRHKETGEIIVLENKTTKYKEVNPATYKNSSQAIGYSIILDLIFGEYSSYKVLYLVYKSTQFEFEQFPFSKTRVQRAQWIQEKLLDIEMVELYAANNYFPMRGESCLRFGRECKYLNLCHLSTEHLVKKHGSEEREDDREYMYVIDIKDLISNQLGG